MKNITKYKPYFILTLIWYIIGSFIEFDFNPGNWTMILRFFIAVFYLTSLFIITIYYSVTK